MLKNRSFKILAICFAALIALTVISRATDSVTVAKVNAEPYKRGALVQRTTVNGEIDASRKHYIRGGNALRIEEILVGQGSTVEAGDMLFTLDWNYLSEQTDKVKLELDNLNLEMRKLRLDSGGSRSAVDSARAELDRALADDEFNRSLNDGVQMQSDMRKIEDAERKLADAMKTMSDNSSKNSIDLAMKENSRQQKQKDYDELCELMESGGVVLSDMTGTVGEIFVDQGETMKGENYCTIVPDDAHFVFIGEISAEGAQYMKTGDAVNVALSGISRPLSNLIIKSISREEGRAKVIADLTDGADAYLGQKATLTHEQKSEEYRSVVPLGGIRGSEGDYYVLTVVETGGILGLQKTASKVEVTVVEKDNSNAAIEGGVSADDLVIVKSSKSISEGDRVRVQSAEVRT